MTLKLLQVLCLFILLGFHYAFASNESTLLHVGPLNHSLVDVVNKRTILALGDSLTAGFVYPGKRKPFPHPYEWELRKMLHNVSTIVQAGIPGERSDQILKRLPSLLEANPKIKLVVILGGTNDLYGRRWAVPANIVTSLQNMYRLVWNTLKTADDPVFIVAMTVPQAPALLAGILGEGRLLVNRNIREIQKRCSTRMALLDLENSFDQTDKENIPKYWSPDLIHFNSHGYDLIGEMLYQVRIRCLFRSIHTLIHYHLLAFFFHLSFSASLVLSVRLCFRFRHSMHKIFQWIA